MTSLSHLRIFIAQSRMSFLLFSPLVFQYHVLLKCFSILPSGVSGPSVGPLDISYTSDQHLFHSVMFSSWSFVRWSPQNYKLFESRESAAFTLLGKAFHVLSDLSVEFLYALWLTFTQCTGPNFTSIFSNALKDPKFSKTEKGTEEKSGPDLRKHFCELNTRRSNQSFLKAHVVDIPRKNQGTHSTIVVFIPHTYILQTLIIPNQKQILHLCSLKY